jgi:hypothetical protein
MAINNYLTPTSFSVIIDRLPNVEFFTQKVNIPSLAAGSVQQLTPLNPIYHPKTELAYADLDVTFIVDEKMLNYKEIYYWIVQNSSPETTDNYKESEARSDVSVIINNSHRNANQKFTFKDCFPTDLSPLSLDITGTDIIYPEVTATFRYTTFDIEDVSGYNTTG